MNSQIDASIPVLTEIIPVATEQGGTTTPIDSPASTNTATPVALLAEQATSADAIPILNEIANLIAEPRHTPSMSAEDLRQMEQNLHEVILRQVLSRVDFVLEHRVRDSLADVLQTSVERLAEEIRSGLHQTLHDIVTRAITQEIAKIKSTITGS